MRFKFPYNEKSPDCIEAIKLFLPEAIISDEGGTWFWDCERAGLFSVIEVFRKPTRGFLPDITTEELERLKNANAIVSCKSFHFNKEYITETYECDVYYHYDSKSFEHFAEVLRKYHLLECLKQVKDKNNCVYGAQWVKNFKDTLKYFTSLELKELDLQNYWEVITNACDFGFGGQLISLAECRNLFLSRDSKNHTTLYNVVRMKDRHTVVRYLALLEEVAGTLWINEQECEALFLTPDDDGFTPLHRIVKNNNVAVLNLFLSSYKSILGLSKLGRALYAESKNHEVPSQVARSSMINNILEQEMSLYNRVILEKSVIAEEDIYYPNNLCNRSTPSAYGGLFSTNHKNLGNPKKAKGIPEQNIRYQNRSTYQEQNIRDQSRSTYQGPGR